MHDSCHEEEYKGHKIKIVQSDCDESPREWDNLGIMACFHKRYDLGDKEHGINEDNFSSWNQMENYIRKTLKAAICLPIYMYDHSGITVATHPFSCPWDSGQIGFIFITKEKIKKEMCHVGKILPDKSHKLTEIKRVTKKVLTRTEEMLESEVVTFDQYLRGDVYGYIIEAPDGSIFDSCYGIYGLDECIKEAKSMLGSDDKNLDGKENITHENNSTL